MLFNVPIPAGGNTQIQYNNNNNFGADALFVWDYSNGKLGVGTPMPLAVLDVAGDAIFEGGRVSINSTTLLTKLTVVDTITTSPRGILSMQFSESTDGARVGFAKTRGTQVSPTTVATGDMLGRLMFRGYDGSNFLEMASIDVGVSGTVASTRVPTYISFSTGTNTTPSVLTEKMIITNSGRVGIGTNLPFTVLDVVGPGQAYNQSFLGSGIMMIVDSANTNRAVAIGYDPTLESGFIQAGKSGTAFEPLLLNPNNGFIGIGITVPTAMLHIKAGTATANTAPLKIDSGTLNTTPVKGCIENDGTHLYWVNDAGTRKQLDN